MKKLFIPLLICLPFSAIGANYECQILTYQEPTVKQKSFLAHWNIGKTFNVDSDTGVMSGAIKNNYLQNPTVIDSGKYPDQNGVKSFNSLKEGEAFGTYVQTLTIATYSKGMPFVYVWNTEIYTGTCKVVNK